MTNLTTNPGAPYLAFEMIWAATNPGAPSSRRLYVPKVGIAKRPHPRAGDDQVPQGFSLGPIPATNPGFSTWGMPSPHPSPRCRCRC